MLHFLHGNQYKNCTLILYNLNVKKNNYYFLLMCCHSLRTNSLARSLGKVKLDSDK